MQDINHSHEFDEEQELKEADPQQEDVFDAEDSFIEKLERRSTGIGLSGSAVQKKAMSLSEKIKAERIKKASKKLNRYLRKRKHV